MNEETQEIPLSSVAPGQMVAVKRIDGGRGIVQRLAEMGISAGTELRVVRGTGPMIVDAKGHRLVIGAGMVDRVVVAQLSG
jgi:Fe2+ transport system protein FeoA